MNVHPPNTRTKTAFVLKLPVLLVDYAADYSAMLDLNLGPFGSEAAAREADHRFIELALVCWNGSPKMRHTEHRVVLGAVGQKVPSRTMYESAAGPEGKPLTDPDVVIEIGYAKVEALDPLAPLDFGGSAADLEELSLGLKDHIRAALERRLTLAAPST